MHLLHATLKAIFSKQIQGFIKAFAWVSLANLSCNLFALEQLRVRQDERI